MVSISDDSIHWIIAAKEPTASLHPLPPPLHPPRTLRRDPPLQLIRSPANSPHASAILTSTRNANIALTGRYFEIVEITAHKNIAAIFPLYPSPVYHYMLGIN